MGFISFVVVGTVSFLFTFPQHHSLVPRSSSKAICLQAVPDSNQQPLSVWNRTVAKYGLEKAREMYSEAARKGTEKYGTVWDRTIAKHGIDKVKEVRRKVALENVEKYGSVWNKTVAEYGLEKAREIYRQSASKRMEKYGSVFNATVAKYGLEKALEIYTENGQSFKKKYGSIFNATVEKYGFEKAKEIYSQATLKALSKPGTRELFNKSLRKARDTYRQKYTIEEIQQLSSNIGVETARKLGHYTRYPGVRFRKDMLKWRVQFSYKGKKHNAGSSYASEREAAEAHDDYVRKLGLNRPLHFPREGERTSYVDKPIDNA